MLVLVLMLRHDGLRSDPAFIRRNDT